MKNLFPTALLALSIAAGVCADNIAVYFSPNGGCNQAVTNELGKPLDAGALLATVTKAVRDRGSPGGVKAGST